jgi:hypothetical protein
VPHLRDGLIVAKVGIRAKLEPLLRQISQLANVMLHEQRESTPKAGLRLALIKRIRQNTDNLCD